MSPEALRERIRAAGRELGFDQVGFAPADRPAHADFYLEWLERGWQGEMAWMGREDAVRRRVSPEEALPGCRTVVMASLRYAGPDGAGPPPGADDPLRAVIARYAFGPDYHHVFEERLGRLSEAIQALAPGSRVLPYVDYGPVLERDHAQRAGLGWIGKNTVLIHPRLGSYLLLGDLLTDLELPPDAPFTADRCGSCTRCIEACPTDAIRGPRELDARRCISYLTIELRGPIPRELRPLIGNRVFGCDICQEVCPWNREVRSEVGEGGGGALVGRPVPGAPVPPEDMLSWAEELLALDDESFRERYRGSALYRAKRDGLLRNLCVGLGNSGRSEAMPVLGRALQDASGQVRAHAAWALGRIGTETAREALTARVGVETERLVQEEVRAALQDMERPRRG